MVCSYLEMYFSLNYLWYTMHLRIKASSGQKQWVFNIIALCVYLNYVAYKSNNVCNILSMIIYVLPGCAVLHVQGIFLGGGLKMYVTCNISFSMQLLFETLLHQGRTQQYIKKKTYWGFHAKLPKFLFILAKQCRNPEPPRTPTSLPIMDKYVTTD